MAVRIDDIGICTLVEPENGTDFQLDELYDIIRCQTIGVRIVKIKGTLIVMIDDEEPFKLYGEYLMIMDEDGKRKYLNRNAAASFIYNRDDDYIVGTVLLCRQEEQPSKRQLKC